MNLESVLLAAAVALGAFGCAHATESEPTPPKTHYAFVTRASYEADLTKAAGVADGLQAADAICTTTAHAASHDGSFHAWLSSSTTSAIDRIVGAGPWSLPRGARVLDNRDQLATQPRSAFDQDENGEEAFGQIWTATAVGGHSDTEQGTCGDWTRKDFDTEAMVGDPLWNDQRWTQSSPAPCAFAQHLLCIEDVPADE